MNVSPLVHALAIDCSTDRLSLALAVGPLPLPGADAWGDCQCLVFEGEGSAKASTSLVPEALRLIQQAGLEPSDLSTIVYGRGPGAFTGLRTACAAAQGLAFGAKDRPVIGVDTLMAVAQEARLQGAPAGPITVLMDARMNEIYTGTYRLSNALFPEAVPHVCSAPSLVAPAHVSAAVRAWHTDAPQVAGNAMAVYPEALNGLDTQASIWSVAPTARAMLHVLPALWAAGAATPPDEAIPVYVRDQVALTTAEREALRAGANPVA